MARYLAEELAADVNSGHNVVATVHVQCYVMYRASGPEHLRYVGETDFAHGVAAVGAAQILGPCRLCAGIVGSANFDSNPEEFAETLEAHLKASPNFRGIRFLGGQVERLPFREPRFRALLQELAKRNLTFDVNGPETFPLDFDGVLGGIAVLASACPEATIIVDHCGGLVGPRAFPEGDVGAAELEKWKGLIASLAALPNVYMKLGGLMMPPSGHRLEEREVPMGSEELCDLMFPYISYCLDCFGAGRCMFESNFPMDKCSVSYAVLWNAFKRLAAKRGMSPEEKAAVFSGTASKVYRIDL